MNEGIRNFLEIPYDKLEELNLAAVERADKAKNEDSIADYYLKYLRDEKRLKALTVCFSDLEGRFHMLDYDKKFILSSHDNLTFDGSSIRGFSVVKESDLRLQIDWASFRWLPCDVFGPGKVMAFAYILDRDGAPYPSDMRGRLAAYTAELKRKAGLTANISVECEGFVFHGIDAEQNFSSRDGFSLISSGGYYNALPQNPLRQFIDRFAEAKRSMGFHNEKDHPEVAPAQFELNYSYTDALRAADLVQLYKLCARQIANHMGYTASFLPKPIAGINGSGMHCNLSLSKNGKNIFYDKKGDEGLSRAGWDFVDKVLYSANDLCLVLNSSVNAYRRLDPHFEAPNQIKASAVDRTSIVRIPLGNEKSARVEIRTVAPDANPYLSFYSILKAGLEGPAGKQMSSAQRRQGLGVLPANIYEAIKLFQESRFVDKAIGADIKNKFVELKLASADRCPKELGTRVKTVEILFHHEITNQYIWSDF